MRKIYFIIVVLLFLFAQKNHSQIIKIENGISISSIKGSQFDVLNKNIFSYSFLAGVDYFNHNNYYLSSELGYVRKGGKETLLDLKIDYLHINTTCRGKIPFKDNNSAIYAGIGPKLDILLNSNDDNELDESLKHTLFGLKPEVGLFTEKNKWRFDCNISYIFDFGHIENVPDAKNKLKSNTFLISLSIGYKLK